MGARVLLYSASGEPLIEQSNPADLQIPDDFDPADAQPGVTCRECGCTDDMACPENCFWVAPALCSSCAPELAAAWSSEDRDLVDLVVEAINSQREHALLTA